MFRNTAVHLGDAPVRLLVLGASKVQAEALTVAHELGWTVDVAGAYVGEDAAHLADRSVHLDIRDVDAVERYVRANSIDLVYSVGSDLAMPVVAEVSERCGLPCFLSSDAARTCNSKPLMREAMRAHAARWSIESQSVLPGDSVELAAPLPWIVKPVDSQGQRGITRIDKLEQVPAAIEYAAQFSSDGHAIVEQFACGPEVSLNAYLNGGDVKIAIASDRETWPDYTGLIRAHILPSAEVQRRELDGQLRELAADAARAVGVTDGPFYLQLILTSQGPRVIEVTPRWDGCHMWRLIQYATGVNLLDLTFRHLAGEAISERLLRLPDPDGVELEFVCMAPGATVHYGANPPEVRYYRDGDVVRPVNGRFEKVGYTMRRLGER